MSNKVVGSFHRLELGDGYYLLLNKDTSSLQICHPEKIPLEQIGISYIKEGLADRLVSLIEDEIANDDHCRWMQTHEEEDY